MRNNIKPRVELLVTMIFMGLILLLINPLHYWMPDMMDMVLLTILVVCFGGIVFFILHEHPRDEREVAYQLISNRFAYLAGSGILLLGVLVQGYSHDIDSWLLVALGVMVLAKSTSIIYKEYY